MHTHDTCMYSVLCSYNVRVQSRAARPGERAGSLHPAAVPESRGQSTASGPDCSILVVLHYYYSIFSSRVELARTQRGHDAADTTRASARPARAARVLALPGNEPVRVRYVSGLGCLPPPPAWGWLFGGNREGAGQPPAAGH